MGPVDLVHLPGESMIEYQLFAQKQKPDRFVVVAAYGDLATGYICTEQAFSPRRDTNRPHSRRQNRGFQGGDLQVVGAELGRLAHFSKPTPEDHHGKPTPVRPSSSAFSICRRYASVKIPSPAIRPAACWTPVSAAGGS